MKRIYNFAEPGHAAASAAAGVRKFRCRWIQGTIFE